MLRHVCRHGITVSLGFTEDVFIPERYMQTPGSMYDATQRSWFWKYDGGDPLWLSADEVKVLRALSFVQVPRHKTRFDPSLSTQPVQPRSQGGTHLCHV